MASHGHFHRLRAREALPEPAVSVVYVTASPTFDGPIAGYSTVGVQQPSSTSAPVVVVPKITAASVAPVVSQSKSAIKASSTAVSEAKVNTIPSSSAIIESIVPSSTSEPLETSLPTEITPPSTTLASSVALLAASTSLASTPSLSSPTAASSSATSSPSTNGGMSGGAKAGIAIGLLLLVGAILSIVLFCFKRRKAANKDREAMAAEREKQENPFADPAARAPSIRTNATAPRLSLRPVTQFIPNLMEKRASRGNVLLTANAAPMSEKALPTIQGSESNHANNTVNPFGNHAETIDTVNAAGPAPIPDMTSPVAESVASVPVQGAVVGAAAVGAVAGAGLTRGASKRQNAPKPMDFTKSGPFLGPPSPAGTDFSVTSESATTPTQTNTSAAIAAAGGPANSAVHRVQLDFSPSMDDELELRAGQLIRMLHEYDDGWALCIRLDRSKQGVVPRTCLSTRPVKPRPQQGGPRSPPQGRQMSPGMAQGRPMTPTGRPMNPNGPHGNQNRPMTPTGRPMTPNGGPSNQNRPMTPNGQGRPGARSNASPQGRPRANSNAPSQARRHTPPGPSPMSPANPPYPAEDNGSPPLSGGHLTRKPVPGQAM